MKTYTDTIIIDNPSPKLLDWIKECRAKKPARREEMRKAKPMLIVKV